MITNPIPVFSGNSSKVKPVTGQLRLNAHADCMEFYDGQDWIALSENTSSWTWQRWFRYYCNVSDDLDSKNRRDKRDYIQQEMQARYPGGYRVEMVDKKWQLTFATPADETWWRLQYD